ncbi:GSDA2 protein, partial [Upupa epops]|nr:GSDA2 protein [Upupa epops]
VLVQSPFNFAELMEDQLLLLLESLDKKIVPQQLELVREHASRWAQNKGSGRGLLIVFQEYDQELTLAMLEMSGMTVRKDGSAVYTHNAFSTVAALYVSLHTLNLLS